MTQDSQDEPSTTESDDDTMTAEKTRENDETVAYCPNCKEEKLRTGISFMEGREGRCRECGALTWLSVGVAEELHNPNTRYRENEPDFTEIEQNAEAQ